MEPTLLIILILIVVAAICEFIDASMGMLYGTILSPVLIIIGWSPLLVVPSILISQAIGGIIASSLHHRFQNVDFNFKAEKPTVVVKKIQELGFVETIKRGVSQDLRASLCITVLGVLATIVSVLIAINIPALALKTYIGVLVLVMGAILLTKMRFRYTWKKILGVGILSSFNKGLSGGGFGPVTTAGQIIAGRDGRSSIGATTLAEAPICLVGFLTYFLTKGIDDWHLPIFLTVGAVIGSLAGPQFTTKFKDDKKLRKILGILVLVLGIWTLVDTWIL